MMKGINGIKWNKFLELKKETISDFPTETIKNDRKKINRFKIIHNWNNAMDSFFDFDKTMANSYFPVEKRDNTPTILKNQLNSPKTSGLYIRVITGYARMPIN
jgi:hypothetical protein